MRTDVCYYYIMADRTAGQSDAHSETIIDSPRIVDVETLDGYRLRLRFDDGAEGVVDMSHLVVYEPFAPWRDEQFFHQQVRIDEWGSIRWSDDLDFCKTALYMQATGSTLEQTRRPAPRHYFPAAV